MGLPTIHRGLRSLVAADVAAAGLLAGAAAAHADEDPRVEQYRQLIGALKPLVQQPECDRVPEPGRWVDAGTPDEGSGNVLISAHRGANDLAPENTLRSYEYAFAYGVDMVEVDVQQTRDGRFVAMHDATVDRTTNGTGNVSDLTFDEIRAPSTPPSTSPGGAVNTTAPGPPRWRRSSRWHSESAAVSNSISRGPSPRKARSPSW